MAKIYTYISPKGKTSNLVDSSNLVTRTELTNKIQEVKSYTDIEIDKILDGVTDKFDTLRELADAINNDPNFYIDISNKIENKANKEDLLYSNDKMEGVTNLSEAIDFLLNKESELVLDWEKIENKPTIISSVHATNEGVFFMSEDGQQISSVLSISDNDIDLILQELI